MRSILDKSARAADVVSRIMREVESYGNRPLPDALVDAYIAAKERCDALRRAAESAAA